MSLASELRDFAGRHDCADLVGHLVIEVPTVRQMIRYERAEAQAAAECARRERLRADSARAERSKEPWTQLDDRRVERDARLGLSPRQTALALGRTEAAIRTRRCVLGCNRKAGGK